MVLSRCSQMGAMVGLGQVLGDGRTLISLLQCINHNMPGYEFSSPKNVSRGTITNCHIYLLSKRFYLKITMKISFFLAEYI